ncbi:MAG: hypothetical protein V4446_00455 [Pseudomonadota bacterium]
MQTVLRTFMEDVASKKGIQKAIAEGVFTNNATNEKVLNLPGAAYGFCVRLNEEERNAVFAEAQDKKTTRLINVNQWRPLSEDIYPLYWGKDKMLGARIHQHLKNSKTTGLARLSAYSTLHDKNIACVALTVTQYAQFEAALQNERPHLLLAVTRVL